MGSSHSDTTRDAHQDADLHGRICEPVLSLTIALSVDLLLDSRDRISDHSCLCSHDLSRALAGEYAVREGYAGRCPSVKVLCITRSIRERRRTL